jgi:hypothetical protein
MCIPILKQLDYKVSIFTYEGSKNGSPSIREVNSRLPQSLDLEINPLDVILIKVTPSDPVIPPSIESIVSTNVTANSAILSSSLLGLGSSRIAEVSFEWGVDGNCENETLPMIISDNIEFESTIAELEPDTTSG